jgi:hypothetical protein
MVHENPAHGPPGQGEELGAASRWATLEVHEPQVRLVDEIGGP